RRLNMRLRAIFERPRPVIQVPLLSLESSDSSQIAQPPKRRQIRSNVTVTVNPFKMGEADLLCPWQEPSHNDLYVPVDHPDAAFRDFKGLVSNYQPGTPLVVIVSGETGCGKSALLHRCAFHLKNASPTLGSSAAIAIVDLTSEGIASEPAERKATYVVAAV